MKKVLNNLYDFIEEQKEYYPTLPLDEPWEENVWWATKEWLPKRGNEESLRFNRISRMKGFKNQLIGDSLYIDFIKAMIVFIYRRNTSSSFQKIKAHLLNFKRLYAGLVELKGQTNPIYLDENVAEHVDECLIKHGYENMSDAMTDLSFLTKQISQLNITLTPINFINKHEKHNATVKKDINKKRAKADEVDDCERSGEEKIMSWIALKCFAWISNNPANVWERLGCRIMDLFIVMGSRGNEVLYLPYDCWLEEERCDENTGKLLRDNEGNVICTHGIRYEAEKGDASRIHWLSDLEVPVAKRAIDEIKELTEPYRKQIEFIAAHNGERFVNLDGDNFIRGLWDEILLSEMIGFVVSPGNCYRDPNNSRAIREDAKRWAENAGLKPKIYQPHINPLTGKRVIDPVYIVSDVEKVISSYYQNPEKPLEVKYKKNGKVIITNLADMLIIAPPAALNFRRGTRVHAAPQLINLEDFNGFIGAKDCQQSIFEKYGFKEEDGSKIRLTSHMTRHNTNTFLQLAGMAEHQQAIAMGRRDVKQNQAYHHASMNEKMSIQKNLIDYKNKQKSKQSLVPKTDNEIENCTNAVKPVVLDRRLSEKHAVQQAFFAFDGPENKQEYLSKALDAESLLGELQEDYKKIKKKHGLKKAKEFINTHGRHLHIVPNGACTRDITLHGCPSFLKCIDAKGCAHLLITGRKGELEEIEYNYKNSLLNLKKMEEQYGDNAIYTDFLERQRMKVSNFNKVLEMAKRHRLKKPTQVFPEGLYLNAPKKRVTVIDRFAEEMNPKEKDDA